MSFLFLNNLHFFILAYRYRLIVNFYVCKNKKINKEILSIFPRNNFTWTRNLIEPRLKLRINMLVWMEKERLKKKERKERKEGRYFWVRKTMDKRRRSGENGDIGESRDVRDCRDPRASEIRVPLWSWDHLDNYHKWRTTDWLREGVASGKIGRPARKQNA